MKLRNKKTGGLANLIVDKDLLRVRTDAGWADYKSLAELNKEWEDFEEPKDYFSLDNVGQILKDTDGDDWVDKSRKQIGNYFETEEEAEKAVVKLKAWHKLMDYWESEILGWEIRDTPTGGDWQTVNVKLNVRARKEPMELLDWLFEGEE